ncbi:MAG: DUF2953 domain-containing protein [Paracoccaceae bacterium]|nr:DUF2953 domain-containing protein [Paracoccaceae bacterium]
MLAALLWLVALLALALLALALTPVHLSVMAQSEPRPRVRIGAAPLGGLVPAIPVYDSARSKRPKEKKKPRQRGEKSACRKAGKGLPAGGGRAVARLLAELFAQIRFDHLHVEAEYGLGDPADTGQLFGWLTALAQVACRPGVSLALRPDFGRAVLAGEFDAAVRITPATLLPPALRFAWALRRAGP